MTEAARASLRFVAEPVGAAPVAGLATPVATAAISDGTKDDGVRISVSSQLTDDFNTALTSRFPQLCIVSAPAERPWAFETADVLLIRPTADWLPTLGTPAPPGWPGRVRWVCAANAGIDFYPGWLLDGPVVSCGRGVTADQIADYTISAIYQHRKNVHAVAVRSPAAWGAASNDLVTGSVVGAQLGILGFGAIGQAIAARAIALGMRVSAFRRRTLPSPIAGVRTCVRAEDVVSSADELVLALPGTNETRGLLGADLLRHAKADAHVINVGRGHAIDQTALVSALDEGRLGFATLDVTDPEPLPEGHPLWLHERVRITPHIASNHRVTQAALFEKVADNFDRFLRGAPLIDVVDPVLGY